jgi:hypothetical protein
MKVFDAKVWRKPTNNQPIMKRFTIFHFGGMGSSSSGIEIIKMFCY